jgi:hypothetical protein
MNINRDNYEEFFVLYIDKELNPAGRAAVENFVIQNPDLKTELEMLQQTILPLDEMQTFSNKDVLLKKDSAPVNALINDLNCEEFFVRYGDNELNNNENALVEEFIYRHPQYQEHFELIQQVKFQPEKHIIFPDKSILYRSENDSKVVPMFTRMRSWKMIAAAAMFLMIGGTAWYALSDKAGKDNDSNGLASGNPPAVKTPVADKPNIPVGQPSTPTVKDAIPGKKSLSVVDTPGYPVNKSADYATNQSLGKKVSETRKSNNAELQKLIKKSEQPTDKSFAQAPPKKNENPSNISNTPNVKQGNEGTKIEESKSDGTNTINGLNKKDASDKTIIVPVAPNKDQSLAMVEPENSSVKNKVAIGPVELKSDNIFTRLANENDEEFEQSDKKNKMRGIFRKVTRVFDKATSREPAENRKGVRIASFSIGLK